MLDVKQVRFKSAALRLIFDQSHVAFLAVIMNASAYTFVSWDRVERGLLILWLGLLVTVSAVRGFLHFRWSRMLPKCTVLEMDRKMFWLRVGIGVSAGLWGFMGGYLVIPRDPIHLTITTFLLAGIAAGMVGAYAIQLRFMFLVIGILCAPFAARMWWDGLVMEAAISASFMFLIALVGRNVHRQTARSIELGLENEDLVHRLNDASHEIRTPVSAIVGFAEVLRDHPASAPAVREYATIIYRNSQYLKKLVDNILLLSRSNSKLIDDTVEEASLREQIQLAVDVVSKRIREKGLRLSVGFAPGLPERVRLHTLSLQQILINLLSNAAKFTAEGEITIQVRMEDRMLVIQVRDTGIGVTPDVAELVFEPFWRENRVEVKRQEGSGLGLALSRSLAVGLGGELKLLQSAPGVGSTFELRLPASEVGSPSPVETQAQDPQAKHLNGKRVVIVDDCDDIRALYKLRLEQEGACVETCPDGLRAVELVSRSAQGCDLILMDINMPIMDGHSAASLLRRSGFSKPILALSAYSSDTERAKCLQSGFDEHLSKSLGINRVLRILESWA